MLAKTQGIILKQFKYNDKSNIVTIFTRDFGKKTFIVYGINSKTKGKFLRNILQPMYIVNLEFYHKETQTLGKIKELSIAYPYLNIIFDFNKKAILMFLSEILLKATLENLPEPQMFDYICNSLKLLDAQQNNYHNFHLVFLSHLTNYLGIKPVNNFSETKKYFNIKEASFSDKYDPSLCLDSKLSQLLSQILKTSITDSDKLHIDRQSRNQLAKWLTNYYAYHIDSFGQINSLDILSEIFS